MTRLSDVRFQTLIDLVPEPGADVDWAQIWSLWPDLTTLDTCPQDPVFHAEGDVGTHTRMVVEALAQDQQWAGMTACDRGLLFWTAVLHDIGKPAVTRHEDGRITSRGHSRVGAAMARERLWHAGVPYAWRETLCGLIARHQLPFWLIERPDPQRLAIETSLTCRPDWLCLHARADALGRICDDQQAVLDNVALAQATFDEVGCSNAAFPFANTSARLEYLARSDRDPRYVPHEHFSCHVVLMSGLPGAGKDTWIAKNLPDLPMISLDAIRAETGIAPTDNQGPVAQAGLEQARTYLRKGQDFVWNATNVTAQQRARILRVIHDYGAHSQVVYVEPDPKTLFAQNRARPDMVPEAVLRALVRKLEPPDLREAHEIKIVAS